MTSRRENLRLGDLGVVPVDTLHELYLETSAGDSLIFSQTKCQASLGGWVYDAAACLAKYLETEHFAQTFLLENDIGKLRHPENTQSYISAPNIIASDNNEESFKSKTNFIPGTKGRLSGRTVLELGAGTGIVGIMAAYLGANAIITDLETLVPLIQYNIDKNSHLFARGRISKCQNTSFNDKLGLDLPNQQCERNFKSANKDELGRDGQDKMAVSSLSSSQVGQAAATSKSLCWGVDIAMGDFPELDFLILANCVYYESSLEPLLKTLLDLMNNSHTIALVCYEVRTAEISKLIDLWHSMVEAYFNITEIPREFYNSCSFAKPYVRLCYFKRRSHS